VPAPGSTPFQLVDAAAPTLIERPDDLDEAMAQLRAARSLDDPAARAEVDEARRRIIDFCRAHPDALHRSCLAGHLTGSAVVVDGAGSRTLLLEHAKLGRWLQPGGHADGDGNLAHVAWREAGEETGLAGLRLVEPAIDVDVHSIPARPGEPQHLHLDLRFAVVAPDGARVAHNDESLGARWVEPGDPAVAGAPDLRRAVIHALAVVRSLAPSGR
jgi:8-oxo-dGTP pyrophosphatase MutT (NUDIX family)